MTAEAVLVLNEPHPVVLATSELPRALTAIVQPATQLQQANSTIAIASLGEQGPPGPPGIAGNAPIEIERTATGGSQTVAMPAGFSLLLHFFVNGLRQTASSYSVVGNTVVMPTDLVAGDILSFVYS